MKLMSLTARRELLAGVRKKYQGACWADKVKILDGFVAATDYERKYTTHLLNGAALPAVSKKRTISQKYNEQMRQALLSVWHAANQICSKRLVPFLPQLVTAMEHHGHLRLPDGVRARLLRISPATVDRILRPEREKIRRGVATTHPGNLLKHQIQVRTFADWDDVTPGFVEADLVAHCGGNTNGAFLNTLVLVDICTGWLECMPLLRKSAQDVIDGLRVADELLPFIMQGLDTDCGSEFINYDVLDYCEDKHITFTRARTHRKNDQAHVEEKNGSVVRRLVGYDRFEGRKAWEALAQLYRVLRMYVNYFQPSLKLIAKERQGAKVSKKYDSAKTPFQRILLSEHISQEKKDQLTKEYNALDPVKLLAQLETLQDGLWKYSWNKTGHADTNYVITKENVIGQDIAQPKDGKRRGKYSRTRFDFLGFSFHARTVQDRQGNLFVGFNPAVSRAALKRMNQAIRDLNLHRHTSLTLVDIAKRLNPLVRGWVAYYGSFYPEPLQRFLIRIDLRLGCWARNKYKRLRRHKRRSWAWLKKCRETSPRLFVHWDYLYLKGVG